MSVNTTQTMQHLITRFSTRLTTIFIGKKKKKSPEHSIENHIVYKHPYEKPAAKITRPVYSGCASAGKNSLFPFLKRTDSDF